jgi:hypothetical protein
LSQDCEHLPQLFVAMNCHSSATLLSPPAAPIVSIQALDGETTWK